MTSAAAPKVFVSYRHAETGHVAVRLGDHLTEEYGASRVFLDIESIGPGHDFVAEIHRALETSGVLLVLMGPNWAHLVNKTGGLRLEDPEDVVALELRTAMAMDLRIVPVLVDDATMPSAADLPTEFASLATRNALSLRHETFAADAAWLVKQLALPPRTSVRRRAVLKWAVAGTATGALGASAWAVHREIENRPVSPLWQFQTGDEVYSSPAVDEGVVYVGSVDQHLYALDGAEGHELWRYRTQGAVTSSPFVLGEMVFVGSNDGNLHAVEKVTGAPAWEYRTGGVIHSSPIATSETVFVGSRDNNMHAVDITSGRRKWTFHRGGWFNSSPTVANGMVYIGCRDHNVYALDTASGRIVWAYTTQSTVDSSPVVSNGILYIGGDDHFVYALGAGDGKLIWEFRATGGVVSTPHVAGRVVYVGSDDGNLYALDANTGRGRWTFPTSNGIRSSPTQHNGVVYVGSRDYTLYALDAMTGSMLWKYVSGGPIDDSSPAVAADLVCVGSLDGSVYAFSLT